MASFSLSLHPEAELDLLDGVDWYAERNSDTAEAFQIAVERAGQMIRRAPHTWPSHTLGTQKHRVKRFPYKIIYRIVDSKIQVLAVMHDRRRPQYWAHRIR